jgi:hypothetical protein
MKQLATHDYRNAAITIAALVGLIFVVNATAQFAYDDHFCFEHIDKRFSLAAGWVPAKPEPDPTVYYPMAPTVHGFWGRATMYELIAGRALHGLLPQWRNPIIKAWQAENPSLDLEPGSFQNPYWIPATTSFNYDYRQAQLNLVPDYCWYIWNWSVKQKLPCNARAALDFWNYRIADHSIYYYEWVRRFRPAHPVRPTLYYPKARASCSDATMYQFIAGRALHGLEPIDRIPIIKEWQAENPSLKLPLGSFQNPYWIPPTTSFNYDYTQALFKSVPAYSWYDCNWFVKQKLP